MILLCLLFVQERRVGMFGLHDWQYRDGFALSLRSVPFDFFFLGCVNKGSPTGMHLDLFHHIMSQYSFSRYIDHGAMFCLLIFDFRTLLLFFFSSGVINHMGGLALLLRLYLY